MVFVFFMCVEFAEKKVIQIFTIEKFNMIEFYFAWCIIPKNYSKQLNIFTSNPTKVLTVILSSRATIL